MQSEAEQGPRYFVRITRSRAGDFGWEIYEVDSIKVHCSTRTFVTRVEALLDSARAAAELNIAFIEPSSMKGVSLDGCN